MEFSAQNLLTRQKTAFMRLFTAIICGILSPASAETLLSTGVRYDTFFDDHDPETTGFEFTVPLGIAYKQKHYSISLETAYSSATTDPGFESEATLSSFTDTLLSLSYTYSFSRQPMGFIGGLDLNLPTGKEQLSNREEIAEAGESNDLFEVDNFGDGFSHFRAGRHTRIGCCDAGHDRFRIGAATRQPAAASIGSR